MNDQLASPWKPMKSVGLMEAIGPLYSRRSEDGWRYRLQTGAHHANAVGLVHGGTLTALADQVMSLAAWQAADRQPVVTIQMDTTFLSAAKPGDFLEAEARVVTRKGLMIFLEATITVEDELVLKASCVMKVTRSRPREERDGK
ncbi:PaaI family thioesterase [Roseibium sp.]|uniref:PaaI family thioesterase n=1 Tax=Roseibium sp. TaxID=1936156 RepID=UPI003A985318